jgi:hypothetical protein
MTYQKTPDAYMRVPLDHAYPYLGIIPLDSYEQDDVADWTHINGNNGGEIVTFVKNVRLKITVEVT